MMLGMTTKRPWTELQILLDRDGMSQTELSRQTGISISYINDMLRGRRHPSNEMRRRIASAIKVPQSMLIPERDNEDGFHVIREEVREAVRDALLEFTGGGEPK